MLCRTWNGARGPTGSWSDKAMPNQIRACALLLAKTALITGCAPVPEYVPPDGPGAYLQNRLVEIEGARFFHFFEYADWDELEPAGINKATNTSRVIFKTNSPYNATYKVSPGPTVVGVRLVYTPSFGHNLIAQMNDVYYHLFVRDMGIDDVQIAYLSENIPGAEPSDFSGMRGLGFQAEEGRTYFANSHIEGGKASVWIEDEDGTIVSPVVTAFGEPNPEIHGAFGELFNASPYVDGLPDPRYGWGISTNLPDPPHVRKERQAQQQTTDIAGKYSELYDELVRLGELRDEGKITQEEFEREKKVLLSKE